MNWPLIATLILAAIGAAGVGLRVPADSGHC
jgi:hypothetical protein